MKQVIVDAKESSFSGMEAAISRLEGGKVGKEEICVRSLEKTTRSRSLEMKERLEIGRQLEKESWGRFGFFKRGETRACLNESGKMPSAREWLIKEESGVDSISEHDFSREVGRGSRRHVESEDDIIRLQISVGVVGMNSCNKGGERGGRVKGLDRSNGSLAVREEILSRKN